MPAGFRRHLVGKTLRNVCNPDVHLNTLSRQVDDHVGIFLNQLIKFYLNITVNIHQLTPLTVPSYTHKMAIVLILRRHFTLCILWSHCNA